METFIYKGYIAHYEIKNGKIIVSSVFYGSQEHDCEHTFDSIGELRRFIDIGGWKAVVN